MSEITLSVDVPKGTMAVRKAANWNDFNEEVKTRYMIDLSYYDVEAFIQNTSSPVKSQRDYDQAIGKGVRLLQAKLKANAKPTCLLCRKSFVSKTIYEAHLKDCKSVDHARAPDQVISGGSGLLGFLVQGKSEGLQSLLTAL